MSLSVLQHVSHEDITGSSFTSISTTFTTQNVTAGSTIHVSGSATNPTVADNSGSDTYDTPSVGARTYNFNATIAQGIYTSHSYNVAGGGKWQVTTTFASQINVSVRIAEITGFTGSGETRDQTGQADSGTTPVASLAVTTSGNLAQDGELVFSVQNETNICDAPPTNFSLLEGEGAFDSMVDELLGAGTSGATTSCTWIADATAGNTQIEALIATYMPTATVVTTMSTVGVLLLSNFSH